MTVKIDWHAFFRGFGQHPVAGGMPAAENPGLNSAQDRTQSRKEWIDIYKGLAITLVIIGHTWSPLSGYVHMFILSAFFMISGFSTSLQKQPLKDFFLNKVGTLIIPYVNANLFFFSLIFGLSLTPWYGVFYSQPFNLNAAISGFVKDQITPDLAGVLWFLVVLFQTSLIARILLDGAKRLHVSYELMLLVPMLMLLYGYSLYQKGVIFPWLLDLPLCTVFYFLAGNYLSHRKIQVPVWLRWVLFLGAVAVMRDYGLYRYDLGKMDLASRILRHPIHNMITSFSGSYVLYGLSVGFSKMPWIGRIFSYIGKRTMVVIILHFLVFRIYFGVFYLLGIVPYSQLQKQVQESDNPNWLIFTALTLAGYMFLDYIIQRSNSLKWFFLGGRLSDLPFTRFFRWAVPMDVKPQRHIYADILIIIATISVVVLHTPLTLLNNFDKMPVIWWQIANVYQSAVRFSVPVLVMLSGALLLTDMKNQQIRYVLTQQLPRIVFPLIVFSIVYSLRLRLHVPVGWNEFLVIIKIILKGPAYYHLWYVYMVIGLYLLTPILITFVQNATENRIVYFLALWTLFACVNPAFTYFFNYKIPFAPVELCGYSGYYVLGYFLHNQKIHLKSGTVALLIMGIGASVAATAIGTYMLTLKGNSLNQFFYENLGLNVLLASAGIFVVVRNLDYSFISEHSRLEKRIRILSETSFGVYLIHILVLEWLAIQWQIHATVIHPLLGIPATALFAYALSVAAVYLIKRLPFSKYIV